MPSPNDIASRMITALAISEPELDTGVGTPIRKMLDAVAEAIAETQIDNYLLTYQYDIDSRSGADLDAFCALFGFHRIQAKPGVGALLLQRSTPATTSILIPAGSQASTSDLMPTVVQTTAPAIFERGSVSVEVPAQAVVGGSAGNIAAGSINRWLSLVEGVSSVSNPAPFTGGDDTESDEELRERFRRTSFRNLAGTTDMYRAVGLADQSTASARVYGSSAMHDETIEVVSGMASSSITSTTETFPIVSATNASPSVITTRIPHHLHNGDYVSITFSGGNTAINGFRRVLAVTGERTFTLADVFTNLPVAGNGAHTANTGIVTPIKRFGGMVDRQAVFGADIDMGEVFHESMYTISRTLAPPLVTAIDTGVIVDGVYDLSYHYVSQASRNRPFATTNRIVDRIDVWVDGERTSTATLASVIDAVNKIEADSDPFAYGTLRRQDWYRPDVGNVIVPLTFSPGILVPSQFYVGATLLTEGTDFWLVSNEVVDERGSMEFTDAIEIRAAAIEADVLNISSSSNTTPITLTLAAAHSFVAGQRVRVSGHTTNTAANGDYYIASVSGNNITLADSAGNGVGGATGTVKLFHPLTLDYTFNEVPLAIQRATEEWRMATSDLLVHKARELPLRIHLAVILRPGFTVAGVQTSINNSISALLTNLGVGAILQISDLLNVVTNVGGVDSARMLASSDLDTFNITAATNAGPIVITTATPHGFQPGDLVHVAGVGGNTAANGTWTVGAVTSTTLQLYGSQGNGTYTAATGTVVEASFAIQIMSPDGTRPRSFVADTTVTPNRAVDIHANDHEHFVLHSTILSVKAQNSFGTY